MLRLNAVTRMLIAGVTVPTVGLAAVMLSREGPLNPLQGEGPFPKRATKCPGHGVDQIPPLAVSGASTNIPEFNDCQRFIIGRKYDSLYAVFYAQNADKLLDSLKALECAPRVTVVRVPGATTQNEGSPGSVTLAPGGPGTVPAGGTGGGTVPGGGPGVVSGAAETVSTGTGTTLGRVYAVRGSVNDRNVEEMEPNLTRTANCRTKPNGKWNAVGIAFAEVVSWGGTYAPLGIKPNFSCLYLYDFAALKAVMREVGRDDRRCLELIDPKKVIGKHLPVRAISRQGLGDGDYPPVARWDRVPETGQMYISMYCGQRWCEIGAPRFRSAGIPLPLSAQYTSASTDPKVRRVLEVKGWYDEQELAEVQNGSPVPSGVFATMVPDPALGGYTENDFAAGVWLPTASIMIRKASKKYKVSWNLDPSNDPTFQKVNRGFLCHGSISQCVPRRADRGNLTACNQDGVRGWYARIVSTEGEVRYKCTTHFGHAEFGQPIPGTVRWAWFDLDEGGWWRCPGSCCFPN